MSVGSFDPQQQNQVVSEDSVRKLLADAQLANDQVQVADAAQHAGLITLKGWAEVAEALDASEIETLIRIFTLGEMQLPGWRANEKSAVVPLVKVLKARGAYDKALTAWIKQHSDNRFLPHGSLLDRL